MQFSPPVFAAVIAATSVDAVFASKAIITSAEHLAAHSLATSGHWNATKTAYLTQTVTDYITYCPTPTNFVEGTKTYTVTEETWVTVDCNGYCTISNQVGAKPTVVPVGVFPKYNNHTAPAQVCPETGKPGVACPPYSNGTIGGSNGAPGSGANNSAPVSGSSNSAPASGNGVSTGGSNGGSGVGSSNGASSNGADSGSSSGKSSTAGEAGSEGPATFTGAAGKAVMSSATLAAIVGAFFFVL